MEKGIEEHASDNKNRWEVETLKATRDGQIYSVVISLTIGCLALLDVISARRGVQQHFTEACFNNGKGAKASSTSWQRDNSDIYLFLPEVFLLLLPKLNSS